MKGGEAETYQNVEIKYIHGRKAVLTIFHDGEEHEKVELSDLKQREDMHAMFLEKGFVRKSEEEIEAIRQQREREMREDKDKKEAERLEKDTKHFEKRTNRQIRELETEKGSTNDPDKKRKLDAAMEDKYQQMEKRREETRRRSEEIKKKLQSQSHPDHSEL